MANGEAQLNTSDPGTSDVLTVTAGSGDRVAIVRRQSAELVLRVEVQPSGSSQWYSIDQQGAMVPAGAEFAIGGSSKVRATLVAGPATAGAYVHIETA